MEPAVGVSERPPQIAKDEVETSAAAQAEIPDQAIRKNPQYAFDTAHALKSFDVTPLDKQ
jgi:hypothetical protein